MGETVVYAIKSVLIATAIMTFIVAISVITAGIVQFGSSTIAGEIFGVISMCLPFNAGTVFGAVLIAFDAIIVFVVARKICAILLKANEAN